MTESTVLPTHSLIIRSKESAQSQEEDDNPHQAVKIVDETEGRTGRLLSIPLEIRLRISSTYSTQTKTNPVPMPASSTHSSAQNASVIFLPWTTFSSLVALLINRQFYFEVKPILYSEVLFYSNQPPSKLSSNIYIEEVEISKKYPQRCVETPLKI